jgi:hypothetical protein
MNGKERRAMIVVLEVAFYLFYRKSNSDRVKF